jgi:galactokinase
MAGSLFTRRMTESGGNAGAIRQADPAACAVGKRVADTGAMRAFAPGRVNLIGDHTDYAGGYVLPIAIDLGTTVDIVGGGTEVELVSNEEVGAARVALDVENVAAVEPDWARYVAGVVAVMRPSTGGRGTVDTTLPVGAGLSSSAALEVATALALGFDGSVLDLALACQRAEQLASGVPCGVMDQLASAGGVERHALLIDCGSLEVTPIPVPADVEVVVVHSGQSRVLADSAYAQRRAELEAGQPRRVRHVETENERVLAFAAALRAGDLVHAGRLMVDSHASLRDDFEVSTPALDALVAQLCAAPGVHGARLTGAGFGGCVVALTEPGALHEGRVVRASAGASVID